MEGSSSTDSTTDTIIDTSTFRPTMDYSDYDYSTSEYETTTENSIPVNPVQQQQQQQVRFWKCSNQLF